MSCEKALLRPRPNENESQRNNNNNNNMFESTLSKVH